MYELFGLLLFGAHLAVFGRLLWRRRQGYHALLTALFALLTASFAARVAGAGELGAILRYAALGLAAITIPWTLTRLWRRASATVAPDDGAPEP